MPIPDVGRNPLDADQFPSSEEAGGGLSDLNCESIAYRVLQDGRLAELLEVILEGALGLDPSELGDPPRPGIVVAIKAYRDWKSAQGGAMSTNVRKTAAGRPQTIPLAYAGKWLAWSEDGSRILAVGDTYEDCERKAVEAGFPPNRVAIDQVPIGR